MNSDAIVLAADAVANADFLLSTTTTSNDTLTIDLTGSIVASLWIDAGDGDDTIDVQTSISATIYGGFGDDTIIGGSGNDTIIGGLGDDTIRGGAGNDLFIWNDGDGADDIDGGADTDTFIFNGAVGNDVLRFSAASVASGQPGDGTLPAQNSS